MAATDTAKSLVRTSSETVITIAPTKLLATDTAKSLVGAIVITVSLLVLYLSLHGLGARIDAAPHIALGEVLAREALNSRGPGGRILAIARDTSDQKNPYA